MIPLDYYGLILQALYNEIELHKWSLGRLQSRARSVIATGAVALSVVTAGMAGFAALLGRDGHDPLSLLDSVFGPLAAPALAAGAFGIASVVASMGVSIHAFRGYPIDHILVSGEFNDISKGSSESAAEASRRMDGASLGYRLQANMVGTLRTLEEYNRWITPLVRRGQGLLLLGVAAISSVPVAALVTAILAYARA